MINLIGRRFTQITAETKKDAMRIALSAKRLSVYIRVQKGNSNTIEPLAKLFFVVRQAHHERKN